MKEKENSPRAFHMCVLLETGALSQYARLLILPVAAWRHHGGASCSQSPERQAGKQLETKWRAETGAGDVRAASRSGGGHLNA